MIQPQAGTSLLQEEVGRRRREEEDGLRADDEANKLPGVTGSREKWREGGRIRRQQKDWGAK